MLTISLSAPSFSSRFRSFVFVVAGRSLSVFVSAARCEPCWIVGRRLHTERVCSSLPANRVWHVPAGLEPLQQRSNRDVVPSHFVHSAHILGKFSAASLRSWRCSALKLDVVQGLPPFMFGLVALLRSPKPQKARFAICLLLALVCYVGVFSHLNRLDTSQFLLQGVQQRFYQQPDIIVYIFMWVFRRIRPSRPNRPFINSFTSQWCRLGSINALLHIQHGRQRCVCLPFQYCHFVVRAFNLFPRQSGVARHSNSNELARTGHAPRKHC